MPSTRARRTPAQGRVMVRAGNLKLTRRPGAPTGRSEGSKLPPAATPQLRARRGRRPDCPGAF